MDDNDSNLDLEFKRYLQIMRPYLAQLLDQDVIDICKSWIQRLSNSSGHEKILRNKYVFSLCYQLARGILQEPFLKYPESKPLEPISEELNSDDSTSEIYDFVFDYAEDTKIIYNNSTKTMSDTDNISQETINCEESEDYVKESDVADIEGSKTKSHLYYTCPEVIKDIDCAPKIHCDEYRYRANNLVMKLREIKTQNLMLHNELRNLKEECQIKNDYNNKRALKVDRSTCCCDKDKCLSITSLTNKLLEAQESKKVMIKTMCNLKEEITNCDEEKKREIEEVENKYKVEIEKIRSVTHKETKEIYEKKLDEMKQYYEKMSETLKNNFDQEKLTLIFSKDETILEKEKIISAKETEIAQLKALIEDQKNHLHDVINKFLGKPNEETYTEHVKIKTQELEKRLNKVEKSKAKFARVYETKLAELQREKHLTECSLQLQLVRQRAQVVNEVTEETQTELNTALNKLESKYIEIVANMQATAIQRRVQDQMALDSILHTACGIRNESYSNYSQNTNRSQFSAKTMQNQNRNGNQVDRSFDSEISALLHGNKVDGLIKDNKSLGEGSVMTGYCLDGERMRELFERVCIPQRDIGDGHPKK